MFKSQSVHAYMHMYILIYILNQTKKLGRAEVRMIGPNETWIKGPTWVGLDWAGPGRARLWLVQIGLGLKAQAYYIKQWTRLGRVGCYVSQAGPEHTEHTQPDVHLSLDTSSVSNLEKKNKKSYLPKLMKSGNQRNANLFFSNTNGEIKRELEEGGVIPIKMEM